ncbi:MAG: hypothetical protein KDE51_27645, partial [Anaerolineales bacterium]|nr:hypothetical protein [Anaerolineales bacterium]
MAQNSKTDYQKAFTLTRDDLKSIAQSRQIRDLSSLTLPEIDKVVELVSRTTPAGNVPGMILNGLARLPGRQAPPPKTVERDINLLFKGVEQTLDVAIYSAFFAGPAAIISGYQMLLKLAGKDSESAFPNGTWQFYVDYALRNDSARHANETHGFDTTLDQHQLHINQVDRMTAWTMAAIHTLHQYEAILENEWRERVYTYLLQEVTHNLSDHEYFASLYRVWERQRPYARGIDVHPADDYATYRRKKFDAFIEQEMQSLAPRVQREWIERVQNSKRALEAYQQQLTILSYLTPGTYGENHEPIERQRLKVGLIYNGRYYLLPTIDPETGAPPHVATVRQQIVDLVKHPADHPAVSLIPLATIKRAAAAKVRGRLNEGLQTELQRLREAPILLNFDKRPQQLPLADIRAAERGVGDHPLTIFDTGQTFVFDQSHIYFDGAWGAALAEIMSNEALAWAVYLHTLPPPTGQNTRPYALQIELTDKDRRYIEQAPQETQSVAAETTEVKLQIMMRVRQLFKQRSDLLQLTVNDLLVLYRALHAARYQPSQALVDKLRKLTAAKQTATAATAALEALRNIQQFNPVILMPIDASRRTPRERLYPMTFEVPLADLDLIALHEKTVAAMSAYQAREIGAKEQFEELQTAYLSVLAGFGHLLNSAKEVAIAGRSNSVETIRLLANIPKPLQNLLATIPDRFEVINDMVKGREVFSNVGAVAPSSTLTRFITAKDDNERKTLCWGVITDANGMMTVSLRDFRPHVGLLCQVGQRPLAQEITQEYLDAYAQGVN